MTFLIDSHCHLDHASIAPLGDPATIMRTARDAGVGAAVTICCRISDEFPDVLKVARSLPNVWCTIGTHPHEAGDAAEAAVTQADIVRLATSDPKVIGIGETGLDYFYNHSNATDQQACFRKHIRAAIQADLPLIIHARDADEDIIKILKEEGAGQGSKVRGVMHCFSSGRTLAEQAVEIGFYISFSGILTFKKADELRAIATDVPLDRLLVETDSPYLSPEPVRGPVNQPAHVVHTARKLAEIKKLDENKLVSICYNNFFNLFTRATLA